MLQQLKLFARKIHRLAATQDLVAAQEFSNRSEEHTSELQSQSNLVCRLLLEKKKYEPYLYYSRTYQNPAQYHLHPPHFPVSPPLCAQMQTNPPAPHTSSPTSLLNLLPDSSGS